MQHCELVLVGETCQCRGSTLPSLEVISLFTLFLVVRELLRRVHEIKELFFGDVAQIDVQGSYILIYLIDQGYYLYCESFILFKGGHWKGSFKIGTVIFGNADTHFIWIILAYLKFAGKTPFILHIFLLMLPNKMIIRISNIQAQFSVLAFIKDLCVIGDNTQWCRVDGNLSH